MIGRRWYVMREPARPARRWAEIGEALGTPSTQAQDWYRRAVARQAEHVGRGPGV
jgi:hypothetical protein